MLKEMESVSKEFLKASENKSIRIICHQGTEGIVFSAILIKMLKKFDRNFSVKIAREINEDLIREESKRNSEEAIILDRLLPKRIKCLQEIKEPILIMHSNITPKEKPNKNIKILNHFLRDSQGILEYTPTEMAYLFVKSTLPENKDISKIAIIGLIGNKQNIEHSKISQQIIADTGNLTIRNGPIVYPSTRPLRRTLEYSISPYIPGITGNSAGTLELLSKTGISADKTLLELNEDETTKLTAAIKAKKAKQICEEDIFGNLYTLKFFDREEDIREISFLLNTCSHLGHGDIALAYCLENEKAKSKAFEIHAKYKQELVSGLRITEKIDKIGGNGFVILNAKDKIRDVMVGTVCSMISSSQKYDEGTVLIGMAYNKDKVKISARVVGKSGRDLKKVLEETVLSFKELHPETLAEVRGHQLSAGCSIEREKESGFLDILKKNLEVEVVKI